MLTKLEAVNRCLKAIGETKVNSLNSGVPDAEDAAAVIDEVSRDVLSTGWHCNTQNSVTITPQTDKTIPVGPTILRIDTTGKSAHINVTTREDPSTGLLRLYDIDNDTYEFDGPIKVTQVRSFEIAALPHAMAAYISARSARLFQERVMGSVALDSFTSRAEAEAWASLLDAEAEAGDYNCLRQSPYLAQLTARNSPINWR